MKWAPRFISCGKEMLRLLFARNGTCFDGCPQPSVNVKPFSTISGHQTHSCARPCVARHCIRNGKSFLRLQKGHETSLLTQTDYPEEIAKAIYSQHPIWRACEQSRACHFHFRTSNSKLACISTLARQGLSNTDVSRMVSEEAWLKYRFCC